jgi:bleomycin hydrolase
VKEAALSDIYRLLVATLGTPPTEFDWTLRDSTGHILSVGHYTPQTFRDTYIQHDMEADYAIFMDDPTVPYYRMYEVAESRNCYEYANWRFLNVPMAEIRKMGVASLAGGRRFYISADTMHDYLMTEGIYDTELFTLDSLLGIRSEMSKEELVRSNETHSVHAVAVAGVRLDGAGEPAKWVIENSYGLVRGWGGYVAATDPWLQKYLYRLVVEKRFVDDKLLKLFEGPVETLPAWYPNY